jgi:hypothetical protein
MSFNSTNSDQIPLFSPQTSHTYLNLKTGLAL